MNSNEYRANAKACAQLAEIVSDPYAQLLLLNMAESWLRLADYVEHRRQDQVGEHFHADSSSDKDMDLK
jgi:hypothetical protein